MIFHWELVSLKRGASTMHIQIVSGPLPLGKTVSSPFPKDWSFEILGLSP